MQYYEVWAATDFCPDSVPFYSGEDKNAAKNFYWTLVMLEFTNVHIVISMNKNFRESRPVRLHKGFVPVDLHRLSICCVCGNHQEECDCTCGECGVRVYDDIALYDHGICSLCYVKK